MQVSPSIPQSRLADPWCQDEADNWTWGFLVHTKTTIIHRFSDSFQKHFLLYQNSLGLYLQNCSLDFIKDLFNLFKTEVLSWNYQIWLQSHHQFMAQVIGCCHLSNQWACSSEFIQYHSVVCASNLQPISSYPPPPQFHLCIDLLQRSHVWYVCSSSVYSQTICLWLYWW